VSRGVPAVPKSTVVEIPEEEQSQMLAALRRARYGYRLALHILLLCAIAFEKLDDGLYDGPHCQDQHSVKLSKR
jgi:hypothetical protein